jgi:hypothetical protein
MNARNIEFAGQSQNLPADIGVPAPGYCTAIRPPGEVINEHLSEKLRECSRERKVWRPMSTARRRYDCLRRRQQHLKEVQGDEWVLIFSWLGVLLLWGSLWWAAFRLLCSMVQLVQYAPGLLR